MQASLTALYQAMVAAGKPVRDLVAAPEAVPLEAVPLVSAFLPAARAFVAHIGALSNPAAAGWSAYLAGHLQATSSFESSNEAMSPADLTPADAYQAYQVFGYLYNGIVDAFDQLSGLA